MAKYTPMQKLFIKEQRRLRNAISKEFRQTGVELDSNLIPKMPSRVTKKALNDIKSIKPQDLRAESKYYDPEDLDREISYEEAKRIWQEEQRTVERIPQIDVSGRFIDQFRESYSGFHIRSDMDNWLSGLIKQYGEEKVSDMLQAGAEVGVVITHREAYDPAKLAEFKSEMLSYLKMDAETQANVMSAHEQGSYTEPD